MPSDTSNIFRRAAHQPMYDPPKMPAATQFFAAGGIARGRGPPWPVGRCGGALSGAAAPAWPAASGDLQIRKQRFTQRHIRPQSSSLERVWTFFGSGSCPRILLRPQVFRSNTPKRMIPLEIAGACGACGPQAPFGRGACDRAKPSAGWGGRCHCRAALQPASLPLSGQQVAVHDRLGWIPTSVLCR
jgi:hypothetical protein